MSGRREVPTSTLGGPGGTLSGDVAAAFVADCLGPLDLEGRSVCLVVPDGTRSCPLPLLLKAIHAALAGRVSRLTALIALGTHAAMTESQLAAHLGYDEGRLAATYPGLEVVNHAWWDPAALTSVGSIPAARVAELSEGRLDQSVDVRVNRHVVDHDVAIVVGPVFPHEVVGFSGGNKYFFPGVAGQDVIDLSHWLGALITSAQIIGTLGTTPVRALIDEAAALVPAERLAFCVVAQSGGGGLHSIAFGRPEEAWRAAAEVSAQTHVTYLDEPVHRVVSVMPDRYADLWTAAKGFYKVEPVVADGGQVIVYAPHVREIAPMHPEINDVGYHCRDYFTAQWDRFRDVHWGVLAHSTHLHGAGRYDREHGERARVTVTLATGIPEEVTRGVNLDYLAPSAVNLAECEADPHTLVVPNAGETLYRLR